MKALLKELGFEHLPMLSEFINTVVYLPSSSEDKRVDRMRYPWICDYTNFITQPLIKGMFVPCYSDGSDRDGEKIINPELGYDFNRDNYANAMREYRQAKERVLFNNKILKPREKAFYIQGYEYEDFFISSDRTIEQAINNGVKLELI